MRVNDHTQNESLNDEGGHWKRNILVAIVVLFKSIESLVSENDGCDKAYNQNEVPKLLVFSGRFSRSTFCPD